LYNNRLIRSYEPGRSLMTAVQDDDASGAMAAAIDAARVELLCRDIATRYPHKLGEADLAEIGQQIAALHRDAKALQAIPLANSDEPAFVAALTRVGCDG
jgi:hypothetical protein